MVKYPQFTKALTNIRIGASSKGGNKNRKSVETHNHFYGQIGPFLLFDDHLTQSQIKLVNSSCVDRIINSHGLIIIFLPFNHSIFYLIRDINFFKNLSNIII